MGYVIGLVQRSLEQLMLSFLHNWPFLLASILIAVLLKLFVDARKISAFLGRHRGAGVSLATAAAVGTPLCSCGTTAVVLGMLASTMPWGPIVAFMVASPLSSPEGMVYTAGLFGWPFAVAMFVASIVLGLAGGAAASALERRGLLAGQSRFSPARTASSPAPAPAAGCSSAVPVAAAACACSAPTPVAASAPRLVLQPLPACGCGSVSAVLAAPVVSRSPAPCACPTRAARTPLARLPGELLRTGAKLLAMFTVFAFVGFLLNGLVPAAWVSSLFGAGRIYGVPLAATIGLPLYVSSEASLPMVRALLDSGMSQGAVMAFLIAGSGTSIGAIVGALTIARWRVVALVVGVLWLGAMAAGFAWNFLLSLGIAA